MNKDLLFEQLFELETQLQQHQNAVLAFRRQSDKKTKYSALSEPEIEPSVEPEFSLEAKANAFLQQINVLNMTGSDVAHVFARIQLTFTEAEKLWITTHEKMDTKRFDADSYFVANTTWMNMMKVKKIIPVRLFYVEDHKQKLPSTECPTTTVVVTPPGSSTSSKMGIHIPVDSSLAKSATFYQTLESAVPTIVAAYTKNSGSCQVLSLMQLDLKTDWVFLVMLHFFLAVENVRKPGGLGTQTSFLAFKTWILKAVFFWLSLKKKSLDSEGDLTLFTYILNFIQDSSNILLQVPHVTMKPIPPPTKTKTHQEKQKQLEHFRRELNLLFS